ncbi:G5 domain-containing protein [Bacillus tianshenii]|nr:G5 domain-containing protein [Bacillus tianshenii]
MTVNANSSFSLLEIAEYEKDIIVDEELRGLSVLASGLYKAVLKTNFLIKERFIGTTNPPYVELGFEAKVNDEGMDFAFYNPNAVPYDVTFSLVNGVLVTTIKGLPLQYRYDWNTYNEETYEPRTVVQYTPMLRPWETSVDFEGKDGAAIDVYQTVSNQFGEQISKQLVSDDFYPPQPKIVKSGLASEATGSNGADGNAGNNTDSNSNTSNQEGSDETTDDNGEQPEQNEDSEAPTDNSNTPVLPPTDEQFWGDEEGPQKGK